MLRQMEFDADRYEARVAGSDTFARTSERLELLNVAAHAAMNDLGNAWRERRLCDDLPSLIRSRERDIPKQLRQELAKHSATGKTGWFDTHPATVSRIKSAKREAAPGIFKVDGPATALFQNFHDLSCRATVAFYHEQLGGQVKPEHIVKTEAMVESRGKSKESFAALGRYFQGLVHPVRPVFPPSPMDPRKRPKADAAAERLLLLRSYLMDRAEQGRAAAEDFEKADGKLMLVARVRELRGAGERVSAKEFELTRGDDEELTRIHRDATAKKSAAEALLKELLEHSMSRLRLALALEPSNKAKPRDEYELADEPEAGSGDRLEVALRALQSAAAEVEALRHHFVLLGTLLSRCNENNNREDLVNCALNRSRAVTQDLSKIHNALAQRPYPYDHAEKGMSLARYVVIGVPASDSVGEVMGAAEAALDAFYGLYGRIMSDLAARAEKVEASLGLPPLPEPPEKAED
jgi:hypothetical protein